MYIENIILKCENFSYINIWVEKPKSLYGNVLVIFVQVQIH